MNLSHEGVTYLKAQIARIAGIDIAQVDIQQPLNDLGFDSLMAVELRSQLMADWAVDIPLLTILEEGSVAHLSQVIQAQLEQRKKADAISPSGVGDVPGLPHPGCYPLSQGQWGLWFLYKLAPDSAAYNVAFTARICSPLDIDALRRSLQVLIDRHPMLRTTFGQAEGDPYQEIHQTQPIAFEQMDASTWDETTLMQKAIQIYQRPFILESSILRASLLTQSSNRHIFILNVHHIAIDGVSFGVLLEELPMLYQASGKPIAVSPEPHSDSYPNFVQWQRSLVDSSAGEHLWEYWQQQLENVPMLMLPTDRPRSPFQSQRGISHQFELSSALTSQLRALAKAAGGTLYMLLLTAFQVLLHRHTGQEDLVIGTPASGRGEARFARTVGFFVNMIALRSNLAGNPTFMQLLQQVRSTVLEALDHQFYPAPLLVERLGLNRDLSRPGLFRATFNLLNLPKMASDFELSISSQASAQWGDLQLEPFEIPQQEGQNDLVFDVMETADRLIGIFRYRSELFDAATIHSMAERFQALLEGIVAEPQQAIAQLPILPASEKILLQEWSCQKATYSGHQCVHQLFEMQVKLVPDAIALVCNQGSLTYQQLNSQADQLAHDLQAYSVAPEVRVGICLERSAATLVAVLAVLKAGGAYVPLDPNYPPERLSFMLTDAQVSLLLTQPDFADRCSGCNVETLYLDGNGSAIDPLPRQENHAASSRQTNTLSHHLAYIVYTSGSTGKAKGVMVEHGSLVNAYFAWADAYELSTVASHLQMANFSFDVFTGDWVRALCSGAKLVLCPQNYLLEPELLYGLMRSEAIDLAEFGPAVLRNLMFYLRQSEQILTLRRLIVGSDAFYIEEYQQLRSLCSPETRLINSYGVSEATIDSTYFEMGDLDREDLSENEAMNSMMPIGRPFANTEIYILDALLQPVPIGITGELHIGGAGLARGYLSQPEQTAESFIHHPFSQDSGDRLYKTGDLARYRKDGTIEYIGRADTQVKLRGFRIELGEIESILIQHPAVCQSVVVVREDAFNVQSLVAYLVIEPSRASSAPTELRSFLKQKLPEPMLPSAFIVLDALPLNANGKVDRRALPQPERFHREVEIGYVAPRNSIERRIAEVWTAILKLDQVGIYDNFFELGGHSLLATQVIAQLRQIFQMELPLRLLFDCPAIAPLSEHIESSWQRSSLPAIQPRVRSEESSLEQLPLTYAQESLWFLDQLDDIGSTYNMPMPLRLIGTLNIAALEQSLTALIQRHEILRTTILPLNSQPLQVISENSHVNLPIVDLRNYLEQEHHLQSLITADLEKPFDLSDALLRTTLIQLDPDEHVLLITLHHIIADGWSIEIFVRELAALYTALRSGQPNPLPNLPIQYADFALWQRRYLQGQVLESLLTHWQRTLAGAPPVLTLPSDRPRPAIQSFHGRSTSFQLDTALTDALKSLSQQNQVTLFMTLLSAFYVLLYRYTHQDDLVVGTPVANRNRSETAGLIGYFVNILVLRGDLCGNPSFQELLARVYQMALDAYSYQDLPFEKLVEAMQPERSLSHTPLFQVMFVLHNAPTPALNLGDLSIQGFDLNIGTAKFDLTMALRETESGLTGFVEYNRDLFEPETIDRLMEHYQQLLQAIVTAPEQRLSDLSLLTPSQEQQLLVEWNQTQNIYPSGCIHQLFEAQVERTPNAIAVTFGDRHLTYQQLNQQANQLAHHLRDQGITVEMQVGIYLERSVELLVAVLAVLKAGGAYLPLDPTYPQERLNYMIADGNVAFLLTQHSLLDDLPQQDIPEFCLDRDWWKLAAVSDRNLVNTTQQTNLAYVVYTSGSTGRAKGVMVEHHSLVNAYFSWEQAYHLQTLSSHLQMASFSFDVFTGDWVRALCSGAKLVLCPLEYLLEPALLYKLMEEQQVDAAEFSPVVMRNLIQYLQTEARSPEIKLVIVGSDSFYWKEYKTLQKLCRPETRIINSYGVSEATIDSTYFELDDELSENDISNDMMPIGYPFGNVQTYILNPDLQPVPIGVVGELYIGGAGIARGYLNQPNLTKERFVYCTLGGQNLRLYKTGDLARYRNNGAIALMGRADDQIKLRGFRIEVGEIEALLMQHAQVRSAAVVLQSDHDQQHLVAYVEAEADRGLSSILRTVLKAALPSYMMPGAIVILDEMPLTPNGKIDRRTLPLPDLFQRQVETELVSPRNAIEKRLADLWQTLLKRDRVGIHDNFFELGGHSLLATQVIAQVRQHFQVEIPLRQLFESPTIAQLGAAIEASYGSSLVAAAIVPMPHQGNLPLSYAQESLWFLDQLEGIGPTYNLPMPLRLTGNLNVIALQQSLILLKQRHAILRTHFPTCDTRPVQVISLDTDLTIPIIDLQNLPEQERSVELQRLILTEAKERFDLAHGSLMRVTLIQLSPTDHALLITLHHIIADGWSIEVFAREFGTLYSNCLSDRPCPLPDLPIQYADFALWQRQHLQGEVLESLLAYWQRTLAGAPPVLTLPTDHPRPLVQSFRGRSASFQLDPDLTDALKTLSQQNRVTLFMTLLAVFQILLRSYSGQEDIVVGSPIANRNRAETAGLIGYFVNILVLRTNLSGDPSFIELLGRVYQVALDAYSHQDLPFEKLVMAMQPERNLSYTPLFQVMFVLQNAPTPELHLPELTIRGIEIDIITSKFDITMALQETDSGLIGFVEYNQDLFEPETIDRLMGHYQQLLQQVATAPEQRLSELSLLTPDEQKQITDWNKTCTDYSSDLTIHQIFEAQVKQNPHAVAIAFGLQTITYQVLNDRANQLAHYLQAQGITTETKVGICLERSIDMMVAVLAVLKAGGAYLPLDPNYPAARLAFMLADAEAAVLITHSSLALAGDIPLICLDTKERAIALQSQTNLPACNPHQLAYVIYTSGSTGKAKGVMVEHRSLVNVYFAWEQVYQLQTLSSHLQMASFSFDVFTGDWVRAICSGAKLVLCPYESLLEPELLYRLMQEQNVDVAEFSPPVLRSLMQYLSDSSDRSQDLSFMKLLIVGSDCFFHQESQALQQFCPQTRLINSYGVSEATIDSTYFEMNDESISRNESRNTSQNAIVPIGRPFPNTQIYVLDPQLQPVPIGVMGELYLGGAGLARGYINRADLTQQRFIQHPFCQDDRLYKTGDLGRYRSDGTIEYGGRQDAQVKLRGFRIELEEIEALLLQQSQVREAIAAVQTDPAGEQYLLAYIVLTDVLADAPIANESIENTLRSFLKAHLPPYMVPQRMVILPDLPRTPNGKIDRQALPIIESDRQIKDQFKNQFVPAETAIEQTLANLWAEILPVSSVGITDNFFDLGGHSLLATSLIFRIRQAFNLEFPLRYLFESPTVAGLSRLIEQSQMEQRPIKQQPNLSLALLKRDPSVPVPLTLSQRYIWHLQQLDGVGNDLNSSIVVRIKRELSPEVLEQSLNEILCRHEVLRTVFSTVETELTQVVLPTLHLKVFYADLQNLPAEAREAEAVKLGIHITQPPFDLETAPLIRVAQFQLAPEEHWLLITAHHIIIDGWSFSILLQEIECLTQAFSSGLPAPLPAVSLQYGDFAIWQQQTYTEAAIAHHLAYWQNKLDCESSPQQPVQSLQNQQAEHYFTSISEPNISAIDSLCRSQNMTRFVVLLAALNLSLAAQSGERDVMVIGTIGNRSMPETETMMGCFINDVILRSQLNSEQTGLDLMHQVQQTVNEAIDHKDVPLQQIMEQAKGQLNLMASITMSSTMQNAESLPNWEVVDLENHRSQWDNLPSVLYDNTTPLELYIEMSTTIRIIANYGVERYSAAAIENLLLIYQKILTQLVTHPDKKLSDFFQIAVQSSQQVSP